MVDWYMDRINTQMGGQLIGLPVYFVIIPVTATSASAATIKAAVQASFVNVATNQKYVDFVILPWGSNWESSMPILEQFKIPAIAGNSPLGTLYQCGSGRTWRNQTGCTAPNTRRFQYAHGISNAGEQFFQPWVGLMKLKKAKTLAVVQTTVSLYQTIQAGVATAAEDYSLDLIYVKTAPLVNSTLVDPDVLNSVVTDLIQKQPDGLVLATQNCVPWIQAFAQRDYAPKSLATVLCTDSAVAFDSLGSSLRYVVGSSQWHPGMNGNDYTENLDTQPWALFPHIENNKLVGATSPLQFQDLWRSLVRLNDSSPGYAEGAVLAPFEMLEGAIRLAGIADPEAVNKELQLFYQPSYFGLLSTNRYGANQQKQLVINQRDTNNKLAIISPPSAATLDFIYPMPAFGVRHYQAEMLATEIEYIVIALMCICIIFTFSLCAYLFANRTHQVFQAAGLPFYLLMGLGAIVSYGSVLTWGVENNDQSCSARVWMWTLGFHMFVDPLLASSWRISRIFSQKLQTVKLTNRMVGAVCIMLALPQILINILWSAIAPLQPKIITESGEEFQPAHTSYTTCSAGDDGVIFTGATLAYSGLLLFASCYFAYKIRKAYRMFNDAKPIGMSMYIFTVTSAIILVIQIALNTEKVSAQKVLFGLRSVGVLICYQSSLSLLYFRRILGQTEVAKYRGKGTSSDDTTTYSGHVKTGGTGSNGKMVFAKTTGGDGHASANADSGMGKNVHVHIQPPVGSPETSASPNVARPSLRGPNSRSARDPSIGPSAVDGELTSTPKLSSFNRPRPGQPGYPVIIQVPAEIRLPTQSEMMQMENSQLITLVQQLNAQNQVLRSNTRLLNLHSAAVMRGERDPLAPLGVQSSLPGTPDRSPRHGIPQDGATRNSTFQQTVYSPTKSSDEASPNTAEMVSLRGYGAADSEAPIAAFTRHSSSEGSSESNHSPNNASHLQHPNHPTLTVQSVEVTPVLSIEEEKP